MINQKKLIGFNILIWCLITIVYAYIYIKAALNYPKLQGYEAEWQFQLLIFSISRLPWLLLALALIIFIEIKLLKN
jgi:hypothetical protein